MYGGEETGTGNQHRRSPSSYRNVTAVFNDPVHSLALQTFLTVQRSTCAPDRENRNTIMILERNVRLGPRQLDLPLPPTIIIAYPWDLVSSPFRPSLKKRQGHHRLFNNRAKKKKKKKKRSDTQVDLVMSQSRPKRLLLYPSLTLSVPFT